MPWWQPVKLHRWELLANVNSSFDEISVSCAGRYAPRTGRSLACLTLAAMLSLSPLSRVFGADMSKIQLVTNCNRLKLRSPKDGKIYNTDVLDTKGVLRLVQSIPSPKAEPFKMWLAQVGSERLDEIADPEKAILRGADFYRAKGYTEGWINQRLQTIEMRKKLTDEWKERGVKEGVEYAILTDEMTKAWSGLTVKEYKELKGLKKENLRDNMTDIELVLNMLAEVTTTTLSKKEQPETFAENRSVAKRGGKFAGDTRKRFEEEIGGKVISPLNASDKPALETKKDNDENKD